VKPRAWAPSAATNHENGSQPKPVQIGFRLLNKMFAGRADFQPSPGVRPNAHASARALNAIELRQRGKQTLLARPKRRRNCP
jgi:hypothetical protein